MAVLPLPRVRRVGPGVGWRSRLVPLVPVALFLGGWEGVARLGLFPPYLLPAPSAALAALVQGVARGEAPSLYLSSLQHYLPGLALGSGLGVALGILVGRYPWARRFLEPLLSLLRPIPPLAWIPFAIVWFGLGHRSAVFIIAVVTFYINFFAAEGAVRGVDPRLLEVARTLGERSEWGLLRRVVLPAALPGILTGLRTGLGQGWMAVVASELVGIRGVGMKMMEASGLLAMEVVVAYMAIIALSYLALDASFRRLESFLLRWRG